MGVLHLPESREEGSRLEEAYLRLLADDLLLFAEELVIPSASGPQLFRDCMAPFQRECFERMGPSFKAVRDGKMPPIRRFWIERTKKAGKDSDLAVCMLWMVAFADRPLLIQVSAANRKQAGIVRRRARDLLFYNPWLKDHLFIQLNRIINRERTAEMVVEATESAAAGNKVAGGTHGEAPNVLILNELVHVARWEVNEAHMHDAEGVPQGIVAIFTNAGFKGTKPALWKGEALTHPERWCVREWKGLAPWLSREDMAEAKRLDPSQVQYNRLWLGLWQSGKGGAVDEDSIDRCFRLDGPLDGPEPGWRYIAGFDLGVNHDHSGVAVLGVNAAERRIKVARVKGWAPAIRTRTGRGGRKEKLEVDLIAVREACLELHRLFGVCWFGYDHAAGGSFMAQELREKGVPMVEVSFSSQKSVNDMAESFVKVLKDGRLECYGDEEGRLRRDFGKFSIVPKPSALGGYKLEAVSDEWGHADVGVSLVMCLPRALAMLGRVPPLGDDDVVAFAPLEDAGATREELEAMPDELRDIYEGAGDPEGFDLDDDWD